MICIYIYIYIYIYLYDVCVCMYNVYLGLLLLIEFSILNNKKYNINSGTQWTSAQVALVA